MIYGYSCEKVVECRRCGNSRYTLMTNTKDYRCYGKDCFEIGEQRKIDKQNAEKAKKEGKEVPRTNVKTKKNKWRYN